ncbi:hypothetical protein D3C87_1773580 [compost metagenome]
MKTIPLIKRKALQRKLKLDPIRQLDEPLIVFVVNLACDVRFVKGFDDHWNFAEGGDKSPTFVEFDIS